MVAIESGLVAASAGVTLLLGLIHLLYTFRGRKLHPRDPDLYVRLTEVSPVLTRETTMWKAWVGFNASHGFGVPFSLGLSMDTWRSLTARCFLNPRFFSASVCCSSPDMLC
jgi:hypothetical protein